MNNKLKILLFLSLLPASIFATHIVGGDLNYKYLGNDTFEIRLTVFRDCYNGIPDFDNPASLGIFDVNNNLVMQVMMLFLSKDTLPNTVNSPCFTPPTDVCYEVTTYIDTLYLPPVPGGYQLAYQRCCRNNSIINIVAPYDAGATYYATIPDTGLVQINSNPVFNDWTPAFICKDAPFTFDHSAADFDGDSLVYELCIPNHGASPIDPMPQPPYSPPYSNVTWQTPFNLSNVLGGVPLTIDPQTGLLTATPNLIGQYVFGICVKEYRNGILIGETKRDFQVNVVNCPSLIVASIQSPTAACGDSTASFLNNSVGATYYYWDFGVPGINTDTSTLPNPTYIYADTGYYQAMLVAISGIDSSCRDTSYGDVFIVSQFIADFADSLVTCDSIVYFSEFSSVESGNVISWNWNFGDGNTSTAQNPSHPYSNGTYSVTLIASTDQGCTDTAVHNLTIAASGAVVSSIQSLTTACGEFTASFLNNSSGTVYYYWDFGVPGINSDTSSLPNPAYTYPDTGYYQVTLVAISNIDPSCRDTSYADVFIVPPFTTDFTDSLNSCDSTVYFFGSSSPGSGNVVSWEWEFGDDSTSVLQNPLHTYVPDSSYMVALITTTDLGCADSAEHIINIFSFPHVASELTISTDDDTIFAGQSTTLHASTLPGVSYAWTPAIGLSDPGGFSTTAAPTQTTTYTFTISDPGNADCRYDTSITIYVLESICKEPDIFIPSAFTPNGDDYNDLVYVRGNVITDVYLTIYNRQSSLYMSHPIRYFYL